MFPSELQDVVTSLRLGIFHSTGYSEEYEYSFEGVFVDEYLEIFDYSGDYEYDDGENVSAPVLNVPEQAAVGLAVYIYCGPEIQLVLCCIHLDRHLRVASYNY